MSILRDKLKTFKETGVRSGKREDQDPRQGQATGFKKAIWYFKYYYPPLGLRLIAKRAMASMTPRHGGTEPYNVGRPIAEDVDGRGKCQEMGLQCGCKRKTLFGPAGSTPGRLSLICRAGGQQRWKSQRAGIFGGRLAPGRNGGEHGRKG